MSLFKDVRKYMGIRESFIEHQVEQTEEDVIRDMYVEGQIFSIGEEVTDTYTGVTGKIIRRGTNYVTFATEDGTTYKKWLYELERQKIVVWFKAVGMKMKNGKKVPNCVPVDEKQDKDIKDKKGTQPIKYFAKDVEGDAMAKSTKDKRMHTSRKVQKSLMMTLVHINQCRRCKTKTKPSKYTNKMKKKFPDLYKETVEENADKSLAKKADASGISVSILKQVYKRGVAAWRTGHQPAQHLTIMHARVNSFISAVRQEQLPMQICGRNIKVRSEEVAGTRYSVKEIS